MITDFFLNSCFSLILTDNPKIRRDKTLFRDILSILQYYENKEKIDIPLAVKNKTQCLQQICTMFLENKQIDSILDSVTFSEKFKQYRGFLEQKSKEKLNDITLDSLVRQVRLRKKVNFLFSNYDEMETLLESIKDGSFDSIDNLVEDYEVVVKKMYSNLAESNRIINIESVSSIDLTKDDYNSVIETFIKKYDRSNSTSTGFKTLDNGVLHGGFEPSRLYLVAGGSGSGKSTLINNMIIRSALQPTLVRNDNMDLTNKDGINKVYIYITLENTIEESLIMRTYQPLFNKTTTEAVQDIAAKVNIQSRIKDELRKNGATIIMKYFPAMSISAVDLAMVIDDAIMEYGKDAIKGIYVDYLDLLSVDTKYDMYRLELGHITLSLKVLAVEYNIPVITATQLGRSAYRIDGAEKLNVDQVGESIKKIEHSDFVCLLGKDVSDDSIVHMRVGKNRSGKSNVSLKFKVDFNKYKFINLSFSSMGKNEDTGDMISLGKRGKGI
jgi:replicative DNA helicase